MQQQQALRSPHEEFILTAIIAGLIFGLAYLIWYLFRAQLTEVLRLIRIFEMWIVSFIVSNDYAIMIPDLGVQYLKIWRDWLPTANVDNIGFQEIQVMTYLAVPPLKHLFGVLLSIMILWTTFFGPRTKYHRRMKPNELMKEQAKSFPSIEPFIKFNPSKMPFRVLGQAVPSKLPMFSEALSPEEWIAFHEIKVKNHQIDVNQAYQALALQLGGRWQGPLKLPSHAQGLYAAFALRHARKRKESEELLGKMSLSWTPKGGYKPSIKLRLQIRSIIKNPKLGGSIQKYANRHAYTTTALLRCLARAREEGGVLAPASFLWLRGQDRALWYPLNNLGRKSYHAEAVGALVHFTNELISSQKIPTPRFEDVVKGIETFLSGPSSRAIPSRGK
ncbi:MAG: hypothetical protein KAH96_04060 [Alphaproteobacteria bacterium]|nr:hypothetical protein [Alphaproteobacteria bacterium]